MRRHHDEVGARGATIVAVGTGDARYARAFVDQEDIPFPVLLDEDGRAAEAATLRTGSMMDLAGPKTYAGVARALAGGHMQHRPGKRPRQLGATFVIGPGERVRYEHVDRNVADHAPIPDVLAALEGS